MSRRWDSAQRRFEEEDRPVHTPARAAFWMAVVFVAAMVLYFVPLLASAQIPTAAAGHKREFTRIARSEWGLDAPVAALAGQVHAESTWRPEAVSHVGARGATQFMPATAKWIEQLRPDLREDEMYSPRWSFRAQSAYMKWLWDRTKAANECQRLAFALASYNGGEKRVRDRQKLSPVPACCIRATCRINPGITAANQRENEHYPRRILLELEARYVNAGWGEPSCS